MDRKPSKIKLRELCDISDSEDETYKPSKETDTDSDLEISPKKRKKQSRNVTTNPKIIKQTSIGSFFHKKPLVTSLVSYSSDDSESESNKVPVPGGSSQSKTSRPSTSQEVEDGVPLVKGKSCAKLKTKNPPTKKILQGKSKFTEDFRFKKNVAQFAIDLKEKCDREWEQSKKVYNPKTKTFKKPEKKGYLPVVIRKFWPNLTEEDAKYGSNKRKNIEKSIHRWMKALKDGQYTDRNLKCKRVEGAGRKKVSPEVRWALFQYFIDVRTALSEGAMVNFQAQSTRITKSTY